MLNTFLTRFLTIFTAVAGLMSASSITDFPRCSLPACLLAVASLGFIATFCYLVYVQSGEA
jgi:hypothetical protein